MYKCQVCQQVIPANTKSHRVVVETRVREYPSRPFANRLKMGGKLTYTHDRGGMGREIVREITACPKCADNHYQTHPG
ncbi:MAG: hypothetical protein ABI700_16865 [Chloroflexota bacterium]